MQSRLLKQLIYGTFYLAIIFGVGYLFYLPFKFPPSCFDCKLNQSETEIDCGGSCQPCELKRLKPITISPVTIFDVGGGKLTALFEMRNLNVNFGAERLTYKINFYNSAGTLISSLAKDSFIYPGEIKLVMEAGINLDPRSIIRADTELSGFNWQSVSQFALPKTSTRDLKVEVEPAERRALVSGFLVNENSFKLSQVVLNVVIHNSLGVRVGASKTLLENIQPFEDRNFLVIVPSIDLSDVSRDWVRIGIEVNY